MARTMTTAEAARIAGCARTTIARLLKMGKIPGARLTDAKQSHWRITMNPQELRALVNTLSPKHGYHHGYQAASAKQSSVTTRLAEIVALAEIPAPKRALLMKLAKAPLADLKILASLV